MTPTAKDIAYAARLIRETRANETAVINLDRMVEGARAVAAAHARMRSERCDFANHPARLAGIAELYRRTDQNTRQNLTFAYHALLSEMMTSSLPGQRPLRVDFDALPTDARPYLLAPYLQLHIGGTFPRLALDRSDPSQGQLVYVSPAGACDPLLWRAKLAAACQWLGDHWIIASHTATTIKLSRKTPLPNIIPMERKFLKPGNLFTGIDIETHRPAYIPFADLTSGTFIPGGTGTGKTSALDVLLQSLFANLNLFEHVYLVDGKDGVAFNRYANRYPNVTVLWEEPDLWALTSKLVTTMRERNTAQRLSGSDKTTSGFIAVVIDEMSTYTVKPSSEAKSDANKAHARFLEDLAMLARRGRSTGFRFFITAQEPTDNQIPTTIRNNCLTTIAFKLQIDAHATAVFGTLDGLPADPRQLRRGHALIKHGMTGEMQAVQFPLATPTQGGKP